MIKCDKHIGIDNDEWCWQCQELLDNIRFESVRAIETPKKMKVIFLDIDGVLNVMFPGRDNYGRLFHPEFVDNLKKIIDETEAKIVMSSTWRFAGLEKMKQMWIDRNLPGELIDITIDCVQLVDDGRAEFYDLVERGHEIQQWLDEHPEVENYVILDDDNDFLTSQRGNFVRTSNNINHPDCIDIGYGLTKICSEEAIRILNRKK
jgi:hypothetical protein